MHPDNAAAQYFEERINYPYGTANHKEKSMIVMIFYRKLEYQNYNKYNKESKWSNIGLTEQE